MGWFSNAVKWVSKKVVKPIANTVSKVTTAIVDVVGDALKAAGNFVSGLLSTKFTLSGTLEGGDGKDILVGLDLGSVLDFLKIAFTTLFDPDFWSKGEIPSELQDYADGNKSGVTLRGNGGEDKLFAFGGTPRLDGGEGNDQLMSLGGVNVFYGGNGNDTMIAAGIRNIVYGGDGSDRAIVFGGDNRVYGDGSNGHNGGSGVDGHDTLTVFGVNNEIDGGGGNDLVVALGGRNSADGGLGNDRLFVGGVGLNQVAGGDGNDTIGAAGPANGLFGGDDDDLLVAIGVGNLVYGDADGGDLFGSGLGGSNTGDDTIIAFGLSNTIFAEGGDDIVTSFAGGVAVFAGDGDDVIVALGGGNALLGEGGDDLLVGVGAFNAVWGGEGDDTIVTLGNLDLSFGGDGDDILVSVAPVASLQIGGTGKDYIFGIGGTLRVMAGDDPFGFEPSGETDDDAKRDGILGFAEQALKDFQFTDFEFEDLSLPTLPSFDDLDAGALDAGINFVTAVGEATLGVVDGVADILGLLNPAEFDGSGLNTAWAEVRVPDFELPNFSELDVILPTFSFDGLSGASLEGFLEPPDLDLFKLDDALLDPNIADVVVPQDPVAASSKLILPEAGFGSVTQPDPSNLIPDLDSGFNPGFLTGLTQYFPGGFDTSGIPDLRFSDDLNIDKLELPEAEDVLNLIGDTLLPSDLGLSALGTTMTGLYDGIVGSGIFQPGKGRGAFELPDLELPRVALPNFDLYAPNAIGNEDSDVLVSVAGASFLFGQEDDDLVIGAGLFNLVFGGEGSDILGAIAKGNIVSGGQGDDIAVAAGLANLVSGGEGSDIIGAGGKFNIVAGGTDADIMIGAGLANLMLGGSGRDVIGSGGKLNLAVGGADDDIILGGGAFNGALGGAGDDLIVGGGKVNVALAGNGNDLLVGGGKLNAMFGGRGADAMIGGGKFNLMDGDLGDDLALGGGQFNVMYTRDGNDALIGGGKFNTMIAGGGTDLILGGGKFNVIMSGVKEDDEDNRDHDIVFTGGKWNTFFAGAGDDLSIIGGKLNTTYLGTGRDIAIGFGADFNTTYGQAGADIMLGYGVGALMHGGAGNDLMFGFGRDEKERGGDDTGSGGDDSGSGGSGGGNNLDIRSDGTSDLRGSYGDDLLFGLGNSVTGKGGSGNDRIFGAGELSFLSGDEGYDFLFTVAGASALDGGEGNDIILGRTEAELNGWKSLVFDGGDIKGGYGSDLIIASGEDLEIAGDVGGSIFGEPDAPGRTKDERAGDDYIVVHGAQSQIYGEAGNDTILVYGEGHAVRGGGGRDLILALGDTTDVRGGGGGDEIVSIGSGRSFAAGEGGNDFIIGKGAGLISWLTDRGADVMEEFVDNLALSIDNIGDFIGTAVGSMASFRDFDGKALSEMNHYAGSDGEDEPNKEVLPSQELIDAEEREFTKAYIFSLIDTYGKDNVGTVLSEIDNSSFSAFGPSYETLGIEASQKGNLFLASKVSEPSTDLFKINMPVSVFAVQAKAGVAPIFDGGAGEDTLVARLGLSLLQGGGDDDTYKKGVRDRVTIIDEEGEGGRSDSIEIRTSGFEALQFGNNGLRRSNLELFRIDADADGARDDLLIRVVSDLGVLRSVTAVLNQFRTESQIETLVLDSAKGGRRTIDLAAATQSIHVDGDARVNGAALAELVEEDVDDLEMELSLIEAFMPGAKDPSSPYAEVFLYDEQEDAFDLAGKAESDDGDSYTQFQSVLNDYLKTLEDVEPGATDVAASEDLNDVLDGGAYDGAPVVQIKDGATEVIPEGPATLQITRSEKDGYEWFEASLVSEETSDTRASLFIQSTDVSRDPETTIQVTPRADVEVRLEGFGESTSYGEQLQAMRDFGFDGDLLGLSSNTLVNKLSFVSGENPDLVEPIELFGRQVEQDKTTTFRVGVGVFIDLEELDTIVPVLSNFKFIAAMGDGTLQLGGGNDQIQGGSGRQTFIMDGDDNSTAGGKGADTFLEMSRRDGASGGDGNDVFELADFFNVSDFDESSFAFVNGGAGADRVVIDSPDNPNNAQARRGIKLNMDEDDILDLSGLKDGTTLYTWTGGMRIVDGQVWTYVDINNSAEFGVLRWNDGIDRRLFDSPQSQATVDALNEGVALVPNSGSANTLLGGDRDDFFVSNFGTQLIDAGDGDDVIFVDGTNTQVKPGDGDDWIQFQRSGADIRFDGERADYSVLRGFEAISVRDRRSGDIDTIYGDVDLLIFDNISIDASALQFGQFPVQRSTEEETGFAVNPVIPPLFVAPGLEVEVRFRGPDLDRAGVFSLGRNGPVVDSGATLSVNEYRSLWFTPAEDYFGTFGDLFVDGQISTPRGIQGMSHATIAVTNIADAVEFGTDAKPFGGKIALKEGDVFNPTDLYYLDPDDPTSTRQLQFQFDAGTTGAELLVGGTSVTRWTQSASNSNALWDSSTLSIDPDANGTLTFSLFDPEDGQLNSLLVEFKPVNDLEFFESKPDEALAVAENGTGQLISNIKLTTVDATDATKQYRVDFLMSDDGGTLFDGSDGGVGDWGTGRATLSGGAVVRTVTDDYGDIDGGYVVSLRGTLDQIEASIPDLHYRAPLNYEGAEGIIVELYQLNNGNAFLQDSFTREVEVEAGVNYPVAAEHYNVYLTPGAGPVELGMPEPFDPDFALDSQPNIGVRLTTPVPQGELRTADGLVVTPDMTLAPSVWANLIYEPDPDAAEAGARDTSFVLTYEIDNPGFVGIKPEYEVIVTILDDRLPDNGGSAGGIRGLLIEGAEYDGTENSDDSVILGGDGNDTIRPGRGVDLMLGGKGRDRFIIDEDSGVFNTIGDLNPNRDRLIFEGVAVAEVKEDFAFDDPDDPEINDTTLDSILTLINGSTLILDGITDYADTYNVAPSGRERTFTVDERTVFNADNPPVLTGNVLNGATDANGDAVRLKTNSVVQPEFGKLTIQQNGSFTYVPDANFSGTDSFSYRPFDGEGEGRDVTITINVRDNARNGSDGDDRITVTGNRSAYGNDGLDEITGGNGANTLDGGKGADKISGGAQGDLLRGGRGPDLLFGEQGNDTLEGGLGDDTMEGGTGGDLYRVLDRGDVVREATGEGQDTIETGLKTYEMPGGVEVLRFTGVTSVKATGNAGNNQIEGSRGKDTLDGGSGNDTLIGGRGDDLYRLDSIKDRVRESAGNGRDTIEAVVDLDLRDHGEQVEDGRLLDGFGIELAGNARANVLTGNAGNNLIFGRQGKDTIDGGAGNDTIAGGSGADLVRMGEGDDRYEDTSEGPRSGNDTVDGGRGDDMIVLAGGNDEATGGNGDDTLIGGADADTLSGGDGADDLSGGNGGDSLIGGAGRDTLNGGNGRDWLSGGDGADDLFGGKGRDVLAGGAGNDTLQGGEGADRFVFARTGSPQRDVIRGFEDDVDTLDLGPGNYTLTDNGRDTTVAYANGEKIVLIGFADSDDLLNDIA